MNKKALVGLSNMIGVVSIVLLVYWVFVYICITVFGFKVFRENLTETFYLSVLGILALMAAALMVNIMFNLTRIAERHNRDEVSGENRSFKRLGLVFGLSFPLVLALLYGGDYLTSSKKERKLVSAAKSIIESNLDKSTTLVNYSFTEEWLLQANDILNLYGGTDTHFPNVFVIVADSIDGSEVFLGFQDYYGWLNDTISPSKMSFLQKTTEAEREYLTTVFQGNNDDVRFSAHDGHYELFYPYFKNGKKIVFYLSEYQRYGKIGS